MDSYQVLRLGPTHRLAPKLPVPASLQFHFLHVIGVGDGEAAGNGSLNSPPTRQWTCQGRVPDRDQFGFQSPLFHAQGILVPLSLELGEVG